MRSLLAASMMLVPVAAEACMALLGDSPPISSTPFDPIHMLYAGGTALMAYLLHSRIKRDDEDRQELKEALARMDATLNKLDRRVLKLELVNGAVASPHDSDPGAKGA